MLKVNLLGKKQLAKQCSIIAKDVCFFGDTCVIFVVLHKLPQSILDFINTEEITIHSWFGDIEMRLFIPTYLLDTIVPYNGDKPSYIDTDLPF